jgi:hypothetical protein
MLTRVRQEVLAHTREALAHAQQQLALQAQQLQALQLACMQREREVEEAEAASERQRSTLLLHVQAGTRVFLTYSRTLRPHALVP